MRRTLFLITLFIFLASSAVGWESTNGSMQEEYRQGHTATVLQDGTVLVVGGGKTPNESTIQPLSTSEIFDPATGSWHLAAELSSARRDHSAVRLRSGRVLVIGGIGTVGTRVRETEIYDPHTDSWQPAGELAEGRYGHTSSLLPTGEVLVAGGYDLAGDPLATVEIFQPDDNGSGTWTAGAAMPLARADHTATVLASGEVLVAGGIQDNGSPTDRTELYRNGVWDDLAAPDLLVRVSRHAVTRLHSGEILMTGGVSSNGSKISQAFAYDPAAFAAGDSGWRALPDMPNVHGGHGAALLPSGNVVIAAGEGSVRSALFDAATETWTGFNATQRVQATLTSLPTGGVLVAGGLAPGSSEVLGLQEGVIHEHDAPTDTSNAPAVTLLSDGRPVRVGAITEVFRPTTKDWVDFGFDPPSVNRTGATATLLPTGDVLVVGGDAAAAQHTAEILDGETGTWSQAAHLAYPRSGHTATLLSSGEVLVVGGDNHEIAEIYDPTDDTWFQTSAMSDERKSHTATLLPSGEVVIIGGTRGNNTGHTLIEIYDPILDQWRLGFGALSKRRAHHSAILMPSGKILVMAGSQYANHGAYRVNLVEIFDPADESVTGVDHLSRSDWKLASGLLFSGNVFAGGPFGRSVFNPSTGRWLVIETNSLTSSFHRGQMLSTGEMLVVQPGAQASRLYVPDYVEDPEGPAGLLGRRPVIESLSQSSVAASAGAFRLLSFEELHLTGRGFHGGSEGHGGRNSGSDVDFPTVRLQSIESDRVYRLPVTYGESTEELVADPRGLAIDPGHYFLYVSRGSVPSEAEIVRVGCDLALRQGPLSQSAVIGGTVTFSVDVVGASSIQWYRDGVPIQGATSSTYTTGILNAADDGAAFWVEARSTLCGQIVSQHAVLTVSDELPVVEVTRPNEGDLWYLSLPESAATEQVTWSASDDVRICKVVVQLRCSNDGGVSYGTDQCSTDISHTITAPGDCSPPGVTQGSWDLALPTTYPSGTAGSLYKVRVRVFDSADQATVAWSGSFRMELPDVTQQWKTLILTHPQRMQDLMGFDDAKAQQLQAKIDELARHPRVAGLVVDVGEPLADAYQAWDDAADAAESVAKANELLFGCSGDPDCVDLQGLIHETLEDFPGIENLVLVGDDRILPMARLLDFASLLPETAYISELADGSALRHALAENHFLSDDPLSVLDEVELGDLAELNTYFLPDLRVGRLVEQPEEIMTAMSRFISRNGELDLTQLDPETGHKVVVTGYDFLADSATSIAKLWTTALGEFGDPTAPVNGLLTTRTWGAGTVQGRRDEMLRGLCGYDGSPYGVMSLSGHGTHFELGVPGQNRYDIQGVPTEVLNSADACADLNAGDGGLDLAGGLVYAVGCHAGLSVPDDPGQDHPTDLPQVMLGRGAGAFVANSGYGWGLLNTIGYSERLVELFTEELVAADLPSPVGYLVTNAKWSYLLEQIRRDAYDRKTLMQWTLYGLPMYQVRTVTEGTLRAPEETAPAFEDLPIVDTRDGVTVARRPVTDGEDSLSLPPYLSRVDHTFGFADDSYRKYDSQGLPVDDGIEGCPDPQTGEEPGCYYALNEQVVAEANQPILPRFTYRSGLSGTSQHGVLWLGGTYRQESSWQGIAGHLVSNFPSESADTGGVLSAAPRLIFNRPTIPRHVPGQDPDDCRPATNELNHLVVSTGEVLEDPATPEEGFNLHRRYSSMSLEIFYLNDTDEGSTRNCDRQGPEILEGFEDSFHQVDGNTLTWAVQDTGDLWRVVVVYDDGTLTADGEGTWQPLELVPGVNGDGAPIWEASLIFQDPTLVTYFIQAVDHQGNVSWLEYEPSDVTGDGTELRIPLPVDAPVERGTAQLAVSLQDTDEIAATGGTVQYGIHVHNPDVASATGLEVMLELPLGSVYQAGAGDGWQCASQDVSQEVTVICHRARLAAGASSRINVFATAPASPGTVTATVHLSAFENDPVLDDNVATAEIEVIDGSDLWIHKETDDTIVLMPESGDPVEVTYTIWVGNDGLEPVTGAVVRDVMPPVLENVVWQCFAFLGSCSSSGTGNIEDTVTLPSGGQLLYTVTAQLPGGTGEGEMMNVAEVDGPTEARDPIPSNNTSSASTEIVAPGNLLFMDGFESGDLGDWGASFAGETR